MHEIVALGEFVEHHGNVGRIVLQIGVEHNDHVAGGQMNSGVEGGRLPEVAAEVHDLHPPIGPRDLLHDAPRAVVRAVIDK